jgi:hypothetical protein
LWEVLAANRNKVDVDCEIKWDKDGIRNEELLSILLRLEKISMHHECLRRIVVQVPHAIAGNWELNELCPVTQFCLKWRFRKAVARKLEKDKGEQQGD